MVGNVHLCPACKHKMKNISDKFEGSEGLNSTFSEEDYRVLSQIKKYNVSEESIKNVLLASKKGNPDGKDYELPYEHIKALVFGDTHIGHKKYNSKLMNLAVKAAKEEKVNIIMCTGDIADGWYQKRPASIFEQNEIGFDNQMNASVREFKKFKGIAPIYYITGNHEYNTFVQGAGVEFGEVLNMKLNQEGIENYYLGNAEGNIKLRNGFKIKLLHPDGGTSYAISYKSQKIVESLQGNDKELPDMALIGHFHKSEYIPYQGVHVFQTGTLMDQSKFMRGKGIPAHMGFWIVDIFSAKKGKVQKVVPQWYSIK